MPTEAQKTIVITTGYWSTNIGNAFFQLSGRYILTQVAREYQVIPLTDQPGFGSYFKTRKPRHSLDLLSMVNCQYVVLQGSILSRHLPALWKDTFEIYKQKDIKTIFLGAGQLDYSEEEIHRCRRFLEQYPPHIFVSRDSVSYERFGDLATYAYNGIDNAFFLPLVFPKTLLVDLPYILLSFDKRPEPAIQLMKQEGNIGSASSGREVPFENQRLRIEFPRFTAFLSRLTGKYYGYLSALCPRLSPRPAQTGAYKIIRLDNQINPLFYRKLYAAPNSFAMDVPYGYLTLLANASLTLSDRIHSCIASLAYGNPAMLFSQSPRRQILYQVGAEVITEKPILLDLNHLDTLRQNELDFLIDCFEKS